ncbi:trehalose-phosphatase [Granulibacter bethesdensis]|uniref:trehalose-phosphatase n=1 Tax=Granulibacter bethesdensis TaxID=364410 RepID=UPI0003F1C988|nr:trehalose-phosphatase [Granulibacter bethesdensis]AHJ68427.1 Trehalose 6-phosphate phosphatase [Granulibacter bethesdensis]
MMSFPPLGCFALSHSVSDFDPLPLLSRAALFLDMDGTLLDIAPTPNSVRVEAGLPEVLSRLHDGLGGAIAVVTGRPVEQVEALFPGIFTAIAGEHGGALYHRTIQTTERVALADLPVEWLRQGEALAARLPGVLLERKQRGFVLHFRAVPEAGPQVEAGLRGVMAGHEDRFTLMAAHMAWEVKPKGADKGTAVQHLMQHAPFRGRVPVFIGDDVTDEDGMAACRAMGGAGLRVQEAFGDAAGVRAWLREAVR